MASTDLIFRFEPRSIAKRCGLILAAALLFGVLFNTFSPMGIAWRDDYAGRPALDAKGAGLIEMTLKETRGAVKEGSGFTIFDARPVQDYDLGHLPGAISVPARDLAASLPVAKAAAGEGDPVLVYCSSMTCHDAITLGAALKEAGFTKVHLFAPGFAGWKDAGLEIQR